MESDEPCVEHPTCMFNLLLASILAIIANYTNKKMWDAHRYISYFPYLFMYFFNHHTDFLAQSILNYVVIFLSGA